MERRINKDYVQQYNKITLIQPLAHGKSIHQVYEWFPFGWHLIYVSDSAHHICPYDGTFRNCADCGALDEDFDVTFCTNKIEIISSAALVGRINDCMRAGLEVRFENE